MRGFLFIVLLGMLGVAGCGGGVSSSGSSTAPVVAVTPGKGQPINEGASLNITARLVPDGGQGVTWSLSGPGTLTKVTLSSVTYTAPSNISDNTYVVITATTADSSHAVAYLPLTVLPLGAFANVQPIAVDGGPIAGQIYPNGAFTSVTVCTPGTLTCKTIGGILVDTGSSGLRILKSALPPLPTLAGDGGNPINECVQFPDQSYVWGSVAVADVRIAGEVAGAISIHAIADPSSLSIPSDCSSNRAAGNAGTQSVLGANGILGVGLEPQDCGAACDPSAGGAPPGPAYYNCSGTVCKASFVPLLQQVAHPALGFAKDNNGIALQLPPVSGIAPTLAGSLTFGIGTQSNNSLGDATVFTLNSQDRFTTNVGSTGQSLTSSFISSGLSGVFFPDDSLPPCLTPRSSLFCPASSTPMVAVNVGTNNAQNTVNFSVDNADNLLSNNPTDAAFSALAGPNVAGNFDWGLPFFYGRTVFSAIDGQAVPASAPAAPWWAYTIGFSPQ